MNEPPGARARVALTGLTVAEYFRDEEGQDVLLFIDNIFRFTQAGSEVSALLGRIPSAVGYQPTLATDMGSMQVNPLFFFPRFFINIFFKQFLHVLIQFLLFRNELPQLKRDPSHQYRLFMCLLTI